MEKVTDTIINVGVNDYDITLFESSICWKMEWHIIHMLFLMTRLQ